MMKWKRWEIALAASLLAFFLVCGFPLQVQSKLAEKLTRLHVLANSDSEEDQALKLKVRDAVLKASAGERILDAALLDQLERAAQAEVFRNGYAYPVTVTRENCYFDTRVYETFSLPAGYYDAVRVVIGEGVGKNWWCVIYPTLCSATGGEYEDDDANTFIETEKFRIKFKAVELWQKFVNTISDNSPKVYDKIE